MQIKGMDGQTYHVTGQNQGNWNSAGGILGAASFFGINANNILGRNGYGISLATPLTIAATFPAA